MNYHPLLFFRSNYNVKAQLPEKWASTINAHLPSAYDHDIAKILCEFAFRTTIYNRDQSDSGLNPPNFDVVVPLNAMYARTVINIAWFFYSSTLDMVIVVFTGTYNNALTVVDLDYFQQELLSYNNYVAGAKAHGGFATLYLTIREQLMALLNKYVQENTQIVITGVSLGGATSSLAVFDLYNYKLSSGITLSNLIHYAFASPRVFNNKARQQFQNTHSYNVQNGSDIITNIPFPVMPSSINPLSTAIQEFTHVGTLAYFDINLSSNYDNHTSAYLLYFNLL